MSESEVMDVTKICRCFPTRPKPEITRESFLDIIETHFENFPIVMIEGAEGIGKTTLLAQFCLKYPLQSISVFINPITRTSYDPDLIRLDLLNQVSWILTQKEIENPEDIDLKSQWGLRRWELQKRARNIRQNYYFVIDGLTEIVNEDAKYREMILDLFPFGESNYFKFLISGEVSHLSHDFLKKINQKTLSMAGYTIDEALQSLSELGLEREEIKRLYQVNKLPGFFASIRRILKSGVSFNDLIDDLPSKCADIFDIEWNAIDLSNTNLSNLLSIIAFSRVDFSLLEISQIANVNLEFAQELLSKIQFVLLDSCENNVRYINEAFRKFACTKLYKFKEESENKVIEYLRSKPDNDRSVMYLPHLYNQAGKYDELLSFLTPLNLLRMLEIDQSLMPLRETARLGVSAAKTLQRDGDLIGLGLQAAIIQELINSDIWDSEIEALIAIKDSNAALALIEKAITKEDRFNLLSVLVNAKQKNHLDIQGLEERITNLYNQIDPKKLGEKAIDIASNLINVLPDLAFELVEKAAEAEEGENALDWAFIKLSIRAAQKNDNEVNTSDVLEKIQNKIKDPQVRKFSTASIIFFDYSANKIIADAEKIDRASEKLFILRSWIMRNRESPEVIDVFEYGLKVAINTTEYSPNARDYRELSTPLPYIKDKDRVKKFISIFDGQKGTIEKLGPIEDYVRLLLILATAENEIDTDSCRNRLIDAYLYIISLEDLSTKSSCLARLASTLKFIDPEKKFDEKDEIHKATIQELNVCISELLGKSADQYLATRGIIRALARSNPVQALDIAKKLNGEDRRNKALFNLIEGHLHSLDEDLDLGFIKQCFEEIKIHSIKDDALVEIISRLGSFDTKNNKNKRNVYYYIDQISNIFTPQKRCNASCLALAVIQFFEEDEKREYIIRIFKIMGASWEEIDAGWERVNVGFKIVEALTDYPKEAQEFIKRIDHFRESLLLETDVSAKSYIACAKLCIRAFSGLLNQKLDTETDLNRIYDLIKKIPSRIKQIELFTELALRFKIINRLNEFSELVRTKIRPEIQNILQDNVSLRHEAIVTSAPVLYLSHIPIALDYLKELDIFEKDEAFQEITSFILTKRVRTDPYYNPGDTHGKKLTYDDIKDIINIVKLIDQDAYIFYLIDDVCKSVLEFRSDFSKQQKAEIARELEEVVNKKLPNPKYICHEGYKIVCEAKILMIKQSNPSDWTKLIERSRAISNIADKVYILSTISQSIPKRDAQMRKRILEEAAQLINKIPFINDRINRYEILSYAAADLDHVLAKEFVKLGLETASKQESTDSYSAQKRLIDFAYKLSPDLAASLASIADDDPAREKSKNILQKRLSTLKLKDQIVDLENNHQDNENIDDDNYSQASWTLLGSLNSGRVAPVHFEKTREYALIGSKLDLSHSYPIFAWLIQNGVSRYKDTPQATDYIRPLFEATMTGCELILSIAKKSSSQIKITKTHSKKIGGETSQIIGEMNIEEARQIITKWLKANISDYLLIADGYFGYEELWVLQVVNTINPKCQIHILTSRDHNKKTSQPWERTYQEFWRMNISDQDPPPTEVIILGLKSSGKSPIHDRWWITKGAGLRIGTSLNNLGESRISEISDLSSDEIDEREQIIKQFAISKVREYKSEKIDYSTFTL